MGPHLTVEQRQLALRLKARGLTLREIRAAGCRYPDDDDVPFCCSNGFWCSAIT